MTTKDQKLDVAIFAQAAEVLRAVAHPVRLRILELLEDGQDRSVGQIQAHLGISQSATSAQLGLLRDRGVLVARREGVQVFYSVANPIVLQVIDCIRRHKDCFSGR